MESSEAVEVIVDATAIGIEMLGRSGEIGHDERRGNQKQSLESAIA